jgi:hypothetical protein
MPATSGSAFRDRALDEREHHELGRAVGLHQLLLEAAIPEEAAQALSEAGPGLNR